MPRVTPEYSDQHGGLASSSVPLSHSDSNGTLSTVGMVALTDTDGIFGPMSVGTPSIDSISFDAQYSIADIGFESASTLGSAQPSQVSGASSLDSGHTSQVSGNSSLGTEQISHATGDSFLGSELTSQAAVSSLATSSVSTSIHEGSDLT